MLYEGQVYRPPSEAHSLILQTTTGCPYNNCDFCTMYKEKEFRIKSVKEIKNNIETLAKQYGNTHNSVFLADGNSILMKTEDLLEILNYLNQIYPNIERITTYGSAKYIVLKSLDEMKLLKEAGLSRIHTGMESGDQAVLKRINKGTNPEELVKAGRLVKDSDMELSEYYMVGVGGNKLTNQHAENSADVLNQINPDFIRLRTFIPMEGTELYKQYRDGGLKLLNPHQALQEIKNLIKNLNGITSQVLSDHISNYWDINGKLPEDKKKMLKEIDKALSIDLSKFRDPANGRL